MNKLFVLLTILNFNLAIAGPGTGLGGDHKKLLTHIDSKNVIALTLKNGDYARIQDLKESFVKFQGVEVLEDEIILDLNHPEFNVEDIITK